MTSVRRFPNAKTSVGEARRFVRASLPGYPEELLEVAALLISELATNCVRHTDSGYEVRISSDSRQVRAEVTDWGAGEPTVRKVGPQAVSGRGLAIVEMLSSSWGVREVGSGVRGKTVWFVLEVGARVERDGRSVPGKIVPGSDRTGRGFTNRHRRPAGSPPQHWRPRSTRDRADPRHAPAPRVP